MGKFYQINSELLPLICVENWFECNEIIFGMSGLGSFMSKFCQISSKQLPVTKCMWKVGFRNLS